MKNDEGLDFALSIRSGRMVDITTVPRGLGCNCVCPHCGETVLAKKGRKNRHHFAHYVAGRAVGSCAGGRESALHAAAKQIIASWNLIELPALEVHEAGLRGSIPGRELPVERSELPDNAPNRDYWGRGRVRPDVILHAPAESVWCEVVVTHTVSDVKRSRLEHYAVSTLEFDLSGWHRHGNWTLAALEHALRTDHGICRWVFHAGEAALRERLRHESQAARVPTHRSPSSPWDPVAVQASDLCATGNVGQDWGELVFHPALGLIPKDPARRLAFMARNYPPPKCYDLRGATAFLRRHPHGDATCIVTFGSKGPAGRTSEYNAMLSEFARSVGLRCVYFGIAEAREVRGAQSYERLDAFLTGLADTSGTLADVHPRRCGA